MLDSHRFLLFFAAALLLAITPGPGIFYVLARTLAGGRREDIAGAQQSVFVQTFAFEGDSVGKQLAAALASSAAPDKRVRS